MAQSYMISSLVSHQWKRTYCESPYLSPDPINREAAYAETLKERRRKRVHNLSQLFFDILNGDGGFEQCFVAARRTTLENEIA